MSMEPIAYTYEASEHCLDCTHKRFGTDEFGNVPENATDSDMNPIGAAFEPFEDRTMTCGTCYEPITLEDETGCYSTNVGHVLSSRDRETKYLRDVIAEIRSFENNTSNPVKMTDILMRISGDGFIESTGDQSDWERWAGLFEFNFWELKILEEETKEVSVEDYPIGESSMYVTYTTTDFGREYAIGRELFDEIEEAYKKWREAICPVCGEQRYEDDQFCGGRQCDSATLEEPEYRGPQNYELHKHEFEEDQGPCVTCVAIANAEATL